MSTRAPICRSGEGQRGHRLAARLEPGPEAFGQGAFARAVQAFDDDQHRASVTGARGPPSRLISCTVERTVEGHGGVMERPVEVVVSDLNLASGRLHDAGQRLQDGLSSVDLETRELLGSGWKGGAASAFSGAWDQWHNGAGQVIRGIQTMSELLRVAADQYARADEQGAGAIASASPEPSAGPAPAAAGGPEPSGVATPTASSPDPASAAGSAGSAGAAGSASGAAASGVADAVSQVGQLGGQVSSGLAQAAQAAAGMAQQVGQAVEQIVEQAVQQSAEVEKRGEPASVEPPPSDAQPPTGEMPR